MNSVRYPTIAVWEGLQNPIDPTLTFDLKIEVGFWKHIRPHLAGDKNNREHGAWVSWLSKETVSKLVGVSLDCPAPDEWSVINTASNKLKNEVVRSFRLPLVLLYRSGKTEQAAKFAGWTCAAVLSNGATFYSFKTRNRKAIAKTCYFQNNLLCTAPDMRYRVAIKNHVMRYCRMNSWRKHYLQPGPDKVIEIPKSKKDPFRTAITFVTPATWGFDSFGQWSHIPSVATHQPSTLLTSNLDMPPRPRYENLEGPA